MAIDKMKNVWAYIDDILQGFRSCFSREASFRWFLIVIAGFMVRSDHYGVTSIVRELCLDPAKYTSLIHFFRSTSWCLEDLIYKWVEIVISTGMVTRIHNRPALIGDGTNHSREGSRIPSVKKIHQGSDNSGKPEFIRGFMFGGLGVLVGEAARSFCLPLSMLIHTGNKEILKWKDAEYENDSHVERLVRSACDIAASFKETCWLLMDSYYLSMNALNVITDMRDIIGEKLVELIVPVNAAYVGYTALNDKGTPAKNSRVKLHELFTTARDLFVSGNATIYGELQSTKYCCLDLYWGRGLYQMLRFVCVEADGFTGVLACTDLLANPISIIELYCHRYKIEAFFKSLKNVVAGLSCHFWTHSMPLIKKWAKPEEIASRFELVGEETKKAIIGTYDAIEGFVMFSCIASGLIQLCCLRFSEVINGGAIYWLRTRGSSVPSMETAVISLRYSLPGIVNKCRNLRLVRAIQGKLASVQTDLFDSDIIDESA